MVLAVDALTENIDACVVVVCCSGLCGIDWVDKGRDSSCVFMLLVDGVLSKLRVASNEVLESDVSELMG